MLNCIDDPGGHFRCGVPVVGAHRAAAATVLAAAAGLVAHHLVNYSGWDAGVLQPRGQAVAQVVGAVQSDGIQHGITGDRRRRPSARRCLVIVVGGD